jgi:hypothetical protein
VRQSPAGVFFHAAGRINTAEAETQSVEFTEEEGEIAGDMAGSREWSKIENMIISLLERFPRGRRVIAAWLRNEADEVVSEDSMYAHVEPRDTGE